MKPAHPLVALAVSVPLLLYGGPGRSVRLFDQAGAPLATVQVDSGFTLSFIHSINLSPVDEDFEVTDAGRMHLLAVRFDQLSTGMPSGDEDGFSIENGRFVTRPDRSFDELQVRVSPVPGHVLTAEGRTRALTHWAPVGGLLVLRPARPYDRRTGH